MNTEKYPATYIRANRYRGTLYVGVNSDLWARVANHKNGSMPGFTLTYSVKTLVWYEHHHTMEAALKREKQIKAWQRNWKIKMIEKMNPNWFDLHESIDVISKLVPIGAGPQPSLG